MRFFLTTIIILIIQISCSSVENNRPSSAKYFRDSYTFINPIKVLGHKDTYRFNKEFLEIRYPFSILSNNVRYGVFVENTNVYFKYPSSAFSAWSAEVMLWVFLINPNDKKKIILEEKTGGLSLEYGISFQREGEYFVASTFLPEGLYLYFPIDYHYNPCLYYDGFAAESFFIVGNKVPNIYKKSWQLRWIKWPGDESQRPAIDQARKIKNLKKEP